MPELSHWKRLVDDRKQQTEHVASELRTQGMQATGHVSAAVEELLVRSRRRSEELREVVRSELRRPVDALGAAAQRFAAAREFATEYASAAVKLDVFGARRD